MTSTEIYEERLPSKKYEQTFKRRTKNDFYRKMYEQTFKTVKTYEKRTNEQTFKRRMKNDFYRNVRRSLEEMYEITTCILKFFICELTNTYFSLTILTNPCMRHNYKDY